MIGVKYTFFRAKGVYRCEVLRRQTLTLSAAGKICQLDALVENEAAYLG